MWHGAYLNEIERRGIAEISAGDLVDDLSSKLTQISKIERDDFPNIKKQLTFHNCKHFDSFNGPLSTAAIRIWTEKKANRLDDDTMLKEPRAARLFLLASRSPRPGDR